MLFSNIFHPKIVNHQSECDRPRLVLPQARCVCTLVVPMGEWSFLEEIIGKYAGLWEAPHRTPHFKANETI
jgi:hypothetical protein